MNKKIFRIDGMHCTSCAMNIDLDLEDIPGIKSSSTNYARQECVIEYDEEVVADELVVETIRKTGYKATLK